MRHKQPLKNLQSYVAAATVFSYYGRTNDVYAVLQKLSKTSRAYLVEHRLLLDGFLSPMPEPEELGFLGQ